MNFKFLWIKHYLCDIILVRNWGDTMSDIAKEILDNVDISIEGISEEGLKNIQIKVNDISKEWEEIGITNDFFSAR